MRNPLLALNKLAVIRLATARLLALLMAIVLTTANHQVQAQQQHFRLPMQSPLTAPTSMLRILIIT